MKHTARLLLILAVMLATATATARVRNVTDPDAPRSLPDEGPVSVQWTDPSEFTDLRFSGNRWKASQGNWVQQLAEHLRDAAAKRLPEGERLEITITDIDRAGRYEPWHGVHMQDVRVLRDIYPPSMKLDFRHYDSQGRLLAEGSREMRDTGYLMGGSMHVGRSDNLRYEKNMIDDWLRDELRQREIANN